MSALTITDAAGAELDPANLEAASRPLGHDELAAIAARARSAGLVLERDGLFLYGLGTALVLHATEGFVADGAAEEVREVLSSIGGSATAAALGALPFDSSTPTQLVVPRLLARGDAHDSATLVAVAPTGNAEAALEEILGDAPPTTLTRPDRFELVSAQPHEHFVDLVAAAVAAVRAGELDKVVLAREVTVIANRPFDAADLLGRLRALYPSCLAFSLGGFVGASPELLCRRHGATASTHPLAGTVARSGDPEEDRRLAAALLASDKERTEHRIVVDAIAGELSKMADSVDVADVPHLLELRNVVHLATSIAAQLSEPAPNALEIAMALHPTPAVGGWPRDAALAFLAEHEPLQRDRYAGPLGYLDANGDGEWWLGIRSALLSGNVARLLAGVGIVADSDPSAELAETQLKLQALLAAAVRP